MYINDLEKYLEESKISLYADDTTLYVSGRSQTDIMLSLRLELSVVYEWLKANKLSPNAEKMKYMILGSKCLLQTKPDLHIRMGDKPLEWVTSMKYLGAYLDDHLTFDDHISYVHSKSSKELGILRKSREFLDRKTCLTLYKSLIMTCIVYCDLVYMCTTAANLDNLQKIWNSP